MYLNGKFIKGLMRQASWSRLDLSAAAGINEITVWKIITKEKYSTTSEIGMRIYIAFKVKGLVNHPCQLIDTELMDKESIKLL